MVLWNFDLLWKTMVRWKKKLWYYGQNNGKNYGTMDKTMVLWTKLWYYGQHYGTLLRTMELRFTKEKTS